MLGLRLAASVRQEARKVEEKAVEAARHGFGFCHKTIWVHRKSAILRSPPSSVTSASHTWVVRPRCTGVARHAMAPSRAVPRKLDFSSIVVKPLAPCGRLATQP